MLSLIVVAATADQVQIYWQSERAPVGRGDGKIRAIRAEG
jgi:hypothetical protein